MTFYTLIKHVDYESSSFCGNFPSIEAIFEHLSTLRGYYFGEWQPDTKQLSPVELDECDYPSVTTGWQLNGPGDCSFQIHACSLVSQ